MASSASPASAPALRPSGVALMATGLLVAAAAALLTGRGHLSDPQLRETLLTLRGLRLGATVIAGAALGVGGVLAQGLFRNPLADPSILGTTAGAALGGRLCLLALSGLGLALSGDVVLPLGSVLGALGALVVLLSVARLRDDITVLLLTGFLLSSLFISMGGLVTSLVHDRWELARAMLAFSLGDASGAGPRAIAMALPLLLAGLAGALYWGRTLDVLLSGEDEAATLGVDVKTARRWIVVWIAVLTGAAVTTTGTIGFVGLVVPHALRPFVGDGHRRLTLLSALGGSTFLTLCDVLCRLAPGPSELPLGVVTGLIGGPAFLVLLLRARREPV